MFAHYLSYLVARGQQTVIALFGLHGVEVNDLLSTHPSVLATLKVCFVPAGRQITGQLMMMLTMVAYTFTGLYLLFGGYRRQFFGCRSGNVNVGKPASPRAPRIISVLSRGATAGGRDDGITQLVESSGPAHDGWPGREIHGGSVAPGLAE